MKYKKGEIKMMEELNELLKKGNTIEKGIIKQLDSIANTLQMIYQTKECPREIASILYNQIGSLVIVQEELNNWFTLCKMTY